MRRVVRQQKNKYNLRIFFFCGAHGIRRHAIKTTVMTNYEFQHSKLRDMSFYGNVQLWPQPFLRITMSDEKTALMLHASPLLSKYRVSF